MSEHDDERHDEQEVFALLEAELPRVTPPEDLFAGVLREIEPEAAVVPLEPRRRGIGRWAAGAAAAVAAVIAVAVGVSLLGDGAESPAARAALEAKTDDGVTGEALLFAPDADGGRMTVSLVGVPVAPSGHHYEVWVLPAGSDDMLSVGTFDPESAGDVELEFELPGPDEYAAVDVSVEEDAGPAEHSDTSLATGLFA
jgi:anti-sigma-K factor RskA